MQQVPDRPPMRICFVWQYPSADKHLNALSATALHTRAVIEGFKRQGHAVRMLTFRDGKPHWSDDLITWHPVALRPLPKAFRLMESVLRGIQSRLRLPYFNLFDSYKFARLCADTVRGCDAIYERFWMLASGGAMIASMLRIPILYEVNGDVVEEYRQQGTRLSGMQWAAVHLVTQRMYRRAGKVIAVSAVLRDRLQKRYRRAASKITAVENGADVERFSAPRAEAVEAIRGRYGLEGSRVITFVGTFKPWHGLDLLMDAFGDVSQRCRDSRLLLVGDGPLRPELESMVKQKGLETRVIFTGAVHHDDVPALLAVSDITVLNPKVSGASQAQSPLKLFEYMAAGKAVIAPRIPNYERILAHRENGYLVEPGQQTLAAALEELLEDEALRDCLGQAAARQAKEKHSWDAAVTQILAMMKALTASGGG